MSTNALQVKDFQFSYAGTDTPLFGPVDWTVEEGSFTLLVGTTGCGKTTLLRNVKPELAPSGVRSGSITAFGCDVHEMDPMISARTVGYVSQSPENQLVCDTVWHQMAFGLENMGMDQDTMRRRIAEVAHFLGMGSWFHKGVNELSGGQQQLLNLASVLVMRPRLVLLDEPTAQLDPVAEKNFSHALFRLNRELGLTFIVCTHSPESMVEYATGCALMRDGRVHEVDLEAMRAAAAVPLPVAKEPVQLGNPVITMRDVRFSYVKEGPRILDGFDLEVAAGSIHALVGGNGSGKSTTLRVIAGVAKPQRGKVRNALQKRQALLPQDPKALFACDTVVEELAEWQDACKYTDAEVDELLERYGLANTKTRHPYDLSGGQQQLLGLIKLMLTKPDLLMLDEPTKGLDIVMKDLVQRAIEDAAASGVTIVMSTHDLAFVSRVADAVSMLFDGQVACTQPARDFFDENLFYKAVPDGIVKL